MPHADPVVRATYLREYKRANRYRYAPRQRLYDCAKHANERAAECGAPGRLAPEDVQTVLDAGTCFYCGGTALLGLDHVVPLHDGGANAVENLVCACRSCNASKHRADRPRRWAWRYDQCIQCGQTESKHYGNGLCNRCACASRSRRS